MRVAGALTALGLAVVTSACIAPTPTPTPTDTLGLLPSTPPPSQLLPDLGDVLALRALSGSFEDHAQRTEEALPEVVVYDDGLVVARIEDEYRSIQLLTDELDDVLAGLERAQLQPLAAGGMLDAVPFGCADCAVTIIRTDVDGPTIEAAAYGLDTDLPERHTSRLPYPDGLITASRLLDDLRDLVAARESRPFDADLPTVPIAPGMGG